MAHNVTALILAGGSGKRFAPLTTNKTMLPIMGQPVVWHAIDQVILAGISQVVVITSSSNHLYLSKLKSQLQKKVELELIEQEQATGMAGAILLADGKVRGPLLIVNANDILNPAVIIQVIEQGQKHHASVVGLKMDKYFDGGYLEIEDGVVKGVVEKPGEGNQPSDLVKLVIDYFSDAKELFKQLKTTKSARDDLYEVVLTQLIEQHTVGYLSYSGYWQTLKHPHMILNYCQTMLTEKLKPTISQQASIHPLAVVEGKVRIEAGAKILAGAVIQGPAYIGTNTVVGNHTLVRESVIESNCIIGAGSEVARSYIGPNCKLHHNFVGDSILESDVNPSFGTTFANWRFDDRSIMVNYPKNKIDSGRKKLGSIVAKNVFCGINCSLMPGTTIGANTIIYPQIRLKGSIQQNTVIKQSNM